jgi:hypothetical protein
VEQKSPVKCHSFGGNHGIEAGIATVRRLCVKESAWRCCGGVCFYEETLDGEENHGESGFVTFRCMWSSGKGSNI